MTSESVKRPRTIDRNNCNNEDNDEEDDAKTNKQVDKNKCKVIFTSVRLGPVENADELDSKVLSVQNRRLSERQRTWRKLELRFKQKISRLERQISIYDKTMSIFDQYLFQILKSIRNAINGIELEGDICADETSLNESIVGMRVENEDNGVDERRLQSLLSMKAEYIDKFCKSINNYVISHKSTSSIDTDACYGDHISSDCITDVMMLCDRCRLITNQEKDSYENKMRELQNENALLTNDLYLKKNELKDFEADYEKLLIVEAKLLAALQDAKKSKSFDNKGIKSNQQFNDDCERFKQLSESRLTELNEYTSKCQKLTEEVSTLTLKLEMIPVETIRKTEEYKTLEKDLDKIKDERDKMSRTVSEVKSILHYQKQAYDSQLANVERDEIAKQRTVKNEMSALQSKVLSLEMDKSNLQTELESIKLHRKDTPETIENFIKTMQKTMDSYIQNLKNERTHYRKELSIERQNKEALEKSFALLNNTNENGMPPDSSVRKKLQALEEILKSVRLELKSFKEQEDTLIKELDATGLAFEEMYEKNRKLLTSLSERENANFRLITEGVQRSKCIDLLREEKSLIQETMRTSIQAELDLSTQLCNDQNKRIAILERSQVELEAKLHLSVEHEEQLKSKLDEAEHKKTCLQKVNEKLQNDLSKAKSVFIKNRVQLEKNTFLERRLEESRRHQISNRHQSCNMFSTGEHDNFSEDLELLQLEVQQLRDSMKCTSCHTRNMDTVISKCFHVFCRECLQLRLESRQRKCPQCNAAFGANDVHRIYLYSN